MNYNIAKCRYEKTFDDGKHKLVTEQYLVDSLSVTECETRAVERLSALYPDIEVRDVVSTKIAEIMGDKECGHFWLAKVAYIVIDEKTAKEKRTIVQWLIGAETFPEAYYIAIEEIKKGIEDAIITSISESPVIDTFLTK